MKRSFAILIALTLALWLGLRLAAPRWVGAIYAKNCCAYLSTYLESHRNRDPQRRSLEFYQEQSRHWADRFLALALVGELVALAFVRERALHKCWTEFFHSPS